LGPGHHCCPHRRFQQVQQFSDWGLPRFAAAFRPFPAGSVSQTPSGDGRARGRRRRRRRRRPRRRNRVLLKCE
jgi:hypothetical protein